MSCLPVVYVVDDDQAVLRSMQFLLESVNLPVRTFQSANSFLEDFDPTVPACLILDIRLPNMSGLEVQQRVRQRGAELPIIFMSGYADVPTAVQAMQAGATHFLEKPVSDQQILDLVQRELSEVVRQHDVRLERQEFLEKLQSLSPRECEVLVHVLDGETSAEAAESLGVAVKTIEAHRDKIRKKLGISSTARMMIACQPFREELARCGSQIGV